MTMRPTQKKFYLALAAVLTVSFAHAAKWEPVTSVKGDRVDIDKSRITRQADSRATAWSRLALDRDMVDEYGMRYTAIEALNRYDCEARSVTTLKRVYRRDAQVVREETVGKVVELPVEARSVDDKLLAEACKARTVGDARRVAAAAAQAAAPGKATPMFADMRTLDVGGKARMVQVAEPAAPAPDKPRFIELPKIDKSQAEDPNKPVAKPDAKADPKAAAKPAETKPAAKAEKLTIERPVDANRHDYERQLATSGPRKTAKKKEPEPAEVHRNIRWSYEGEGGPENWGKLESKFATCATGTRQSPIDIREGIIKVDLEPIKFDYKPTQFRVTDNGHTIQVDIGEGSSIKVLEREFQLVQFHFHKPSEERVRGKAFDMVAHLVHKDDDGKLAVVAVLLEKGPEHPLIQAIWNSIPLESGQSVSPATVIDLNNLLPDNRAYYTYMGSLTTPPCSEDVLWMVLKQPVQVSQQQISVFARLYPHNARPVQPVNGRLVKETR
jgi:carbonic anhydrase